MISMNSPLTGSAPTTNTISRLPEPGNGRPRTTIGTGLRTRQTGATAGEEAVFVRSESLEGKGQKK